MERRIHPGFIEHLQTPEELDKSELPKITLSSLQEIKEEIDALWEKCGEQARAQEPWDSDEELKKLDDMKAVVSGLLKTGS